MSIEINYEGLAALSIADLSALKEYYQRQCNTFCAKDDVDCLDVLNEEFYKRVNNIFITD
jgi:hypothetical protein